MQRAAGNHACSAAAPCCMQLGMKLPCQWRCRRRPSHRQQQQTAGKRCRRQRQPPRPAAAAPPRPPGLRRRTSAAATTRRCSLGAGMCWSFTASLRRCARSTWKSSWRDTPGVMRRRRRSSAPRAGGRGGGPAGERCTVGGTLQRQWWGCAVWGCTRAPPVRFLHCSLPS